MEIVVWVDFRSMARHSTYPWAQP